MTAPTRLPKLNLKFRASARPEQREAALLKARSSGAVEVRPLFAGSTDEDLASLHVVVAADDAASTRLMESLQADPAVEFVEPEVIRTLK